jgi:hypothetical protein
MYIQLKNGVKYELIPNGISNNVKTNTRTIKFISDDNYTSIFDIISDYENYSTIYILDSNELIEKTYTDIFAFKSLTLEKDVEVETGISKDVFIAVYGIDELNRNISDLKAKLTEIDKQVNPYSEIDNMSIEELREYKIYLSRLLLEEHIEGNPILSSCHKEIEKYYSINKDKQVFLSQMIAIVQMAIANNIEYQPSWNATGEECTYDWTIEELTQLAFEIELVVRPLISKQQSYEHLIKNMTTKEELLGFEISYETI